MHVIKLLLTIGGWVFIGLAVVDLAITFFIYRHTHGFVQSASRAQATITKMVERPGGDSGSVYYPVFSFQDSNRLSHEVYSSSGQYPPAYEVGDKVTVLYQPDKPESAEIDSFWDVWLMSILFAFSGVFELFIGFGQFVAVYIIRRYERKRAVVHAA